MHTIRSHAFVLGTLLLLCFSVAFLKLGTVGTTRSGDYETYVQTAMYLKGEPVEPSTPMTIPQRLLKPLAPLTVAVLSEYMSFPSALLLQSLVFYGALVIALYLLAYEFFRERTYAVYFVLLSALSYPVLKYGIDVYTETGALFFYVLSLYFTLRFSRNASHKLFLVNICTIAVGFMWKEYSVVSGIVFGFVILFHPELSLRRKTVYIAIYTLLIGAITVPLQLYVLRTFDFTFLTWYRLGGATGFSYEFTLKNIVKSTAALIGIAWLAVPGGLRRMQDMDGPHKRFLWTALPVPLIGYVWGYISSRLLYVVAIPYLIVALIEMRSWSPRAQYIFVGLAIIANFAWLFLSYRITL
jgi:hypothetical protein